MPLSFNDIEKEDYIAAMISVYEENNIHPILDLFVFSYKRSCQLCTATLEALDFDPLRVYYRRERRDIIRHIVTHLLVGDSMKNYIESQVRELIDSKDRDSAREDIYEDLQMITPERIAGMRITSEELDLWKKKQQHHA